MKTQRHLQYLRGLVLIRLWRRYRLPPERMGCWHLWPDCAIKLRRQYKTLYPKFP